MSEASPRPQGGDQINGAGSERSFGGNGAEHSFIHVDPSTSHEQRHVIDAGEVPQVGTSKAEFNDAQYVADLRGAFSSVPKPKPRWQDRFMKIMIVGETGQGKTTFIKNLFASYAQDPDLKINDVAAPTSKEEFIQAPEKLCTEIIVSDHSTQTRFHYRVQDTPGYDSMEVNMEPILSYIEAANEQALTREQDARRVRPLADDDDPRVDVCIYFLSPHRVKPIDLKFITELSVLAPVVPVLAKADSMTTDELNGFRSSVKAAIAQASKNAKRAVAYPFSEEALQEAGARSGVPPFAIVASNTMDMSVGRFWPVRIYPWGKCEALSSIHSDLSALKKLLFEVAYEDLKQDTERRYYAFRERSLFNLDDPKRPVHRSTLAEQLQRTLRMPQRRGLKGILGSVLKTALSGVAVYVVINVLAGTKGQKRLKQDFAVAKEKTVETAAVVADKAQDVGSVVVEKAQEVGSFTAEVAGDVKEAVLHTEENAKRKEEEERAKRGWGPFGLFGKK